MKKLITRINSEGVPVEYTISNIKGFSIHGHTSDPGSWFLTYRELNIFGLRLRPKRGASPDKLVQSALSLIIREKLKYDKAFAKLEKCLCV